VEATRRGQNSPKDGPASQIMWTYTQSSGNLTDSSGKLIATGYSGLGIAKNDPLAQMIHNQGPIPVGRYHIEEPIDSSTHGPYAMHLTPYPDNEMYGRSAFLIHGDSLSHPGTASDGCIIMPPQTRHTIWQSGDHELEVISGITTTSDLDEGDL